LIIIERVKNLIIQKQKTLKDDLIRSYNTSEANYEIRGSLSTQLINDLESKKEEYLKKNINIQNEKDLLKRKISNFKTSIENIKDDDGGNNNINKLNITKKYTSECEYIDVPENEENYFDFNITIQSKNNVDINSDVEKKTMKSGISDATSLNTISSQFSPTVIGKVKSSQSNKIDVNSLRLSLCKRNSGEETDLYNQTIDSNKIEEMSEKQLKKEFVKLFLKLKFDKIDNDHSGQKIDQNHIWNEMIKANVPKKQWKDFILLEFKNSKKIFKIKH